jgi:hypothetical protein
VEQNNSVAFTKYYDIPAKDPFSLLEPVNLDVITTGLDDMIATSLQQNNEFITLQKHNNNNLGGAKAVLNFHKYAEQVAKRSVRGKRLTTGHSFARNYFNDASSILSTILGRYSKITKGSSEPIQDLAQCFNAFAEKFCRDFSYLADSFSPPSDHPLIAQFVISASAKSLGLLTYINRTTDPDKINFHFYEYMRALQEKNLHPDVYDKNYDEWSNMIDFFAKKQAKADVRHFFEQRIKDSQGVSAFQKHMNALFAPYARRLAEIMHEVLLPNVIIASNHPDSYIGAKIAQNIQEFEDAYPLACPKNFANDFTEYDSSQYALSPYANALFMLFMGAPPKLVDVYINIRMHWVLACDLVKLYGSEKMHSGEPFTLIGNTIFGMLVIAFCIRFTLLVFAVFKGDDSAIRATEISFELFSSDWTGGRGLQLKAEYPCHMEFAGMLITPYGFFPDVIRKVVKFLSTVFRDRAHYQSSVINLKADLQCILSAEHIAYGSSALAQYYNEVNRTNKINGDFVRQCLSFLYHQTTVDYADLVDVESEIFSIYSDYPDNTSHYRGHVYITSFI